MDDIFLQKKPDQFLIVGKCVSDKHLNCICFKIILCHYHFQVAPIFQKSIIVINEVALTTATSLYW